MFAVGRRIAIGKQVFVAYRLDVLSENPRLLEGLAQRGRTHILEPRAAQARHQFPVSAGHLYSPAAIIRHDQSPVLRETDKERAPRPLFGSLLRPDHDADPVR